VILHQDMAEVFAKSNLYQMRSFYMAYKDIFQTPSGISDDFDPWSGLQNFQTLSGTSELLSFQNVQSMANRFPLPWSAYVRLLSVKSENARRFYEAEALRGGWSVRQLDRQINSQLEQKIIEVSQVSQHPGISPKRKCLEEYDRIWKIMNAE